MPYAYIGQRDSSGDIVSRKYFIRTSHGIKYVNDDQLAWLFKDEGDLKIIKQLRSGFEVQRHNYQMTVEGFPHGIYGISWFHSLIHYTEIDKIFSNKEMREKFMFQVTTFAVLKSIWFRFTRSWHIGIEKGFDRYFSGSLITDFPIESKALGFSEIEIIGSFLLDQLPWMWEYEKVIQGAYPGKINIPPNSKLTLDFTDISRPVILIKNESFFIEIMLTGLSYGNGAHQRNPFHAALSELDPLGRQEISMSHFFHLDMGIHYRAKFDFFETDVDNFNNLYSYAENIWNIIDYEWNMDKSLSLYPDKNFHILDLKLNHILNKMNPEKKGFFSRIMRSKKTRTE